MMSHASDQVVSELAERLRDRRLYKCIDVRVRLSEDFGEETAATKERLAADLEGVSKSVDRACVSIKERVEEWLSENASEAPRILIDETVREPYKQLQESKGPLNQIRIKTDADVLVDLGERSQVVRAIRPFRIFRLYYAERDDEALRFINDSIKGAKDAATT